mmetsp:Transcript_7652/g.26049  ORF Transcript_7652/g.26049 Transcript_7652/m.26049 type:complete len:213 (-) Transcript_7652:22-660(-)
MHPTCTGFHVYAFPGEPAERVYIEYKHGCNVLPRDHCTPPGGHPAGGLWYAMLNVVDCPTLGKPADGCVDGDRACARLTLETAGDWCAGRRGPRQCPRTCGLCTPCRDKSWWQPLAVIRALRRPRPEGGGSSGALPEMLHALSQAGPGPAQGSAAFVALGVACVGLTALLALAAWAADGRGRRAARARASDAAPGGEEESVAGSAHGEGERE